MLEGSSLWPVRIFLQRERREKKEDIESGEGILLIKFHTLPYYLTHIHDQVHFLLYFLLKKEKFIINK